MRVSRKDIVPRGRFVPLANPEKKNKGQSSPGSGEAGRKYAQDQPTTLLPTMSHLDRARELRAVEYSRKRKYWDQAERGRTRPILALDCP